MAPALVLRVPTFALVVALTRPVTAQPEHAPRDADTPSESESERGPTPTGEETPPGREPPTELAPESRNAGTELPVVEQAVPASYPEQARIAGIEGDVLLQLEITADGGVSSAEVLQGPGHGLEEAAREAVLGFRFRPARVAGAARAARIRYVYEFRLPVGPSPSEPPAPTPLGSEARPGRAAVAATPRAVPENPRAAPVEITVIGEREAQRLERSANAVTVVDLKRARAESSELGQVLARVQGVSVQRSGGLGSEARFSLGGFDEGQVRIFVDGIPLELSGYRFGLQNVPVNLARRVDVYKGVVPIRLGADALGGAFDVVTDHETAGTTGSVSYQGGTFDTHRLSASARHRDQVTGLYAKVEGFFDTTENDYEVDVDTAGPMGQTVPATVHRFHDGYRATGGNLETGVTDRPWAQRLLLRTFVTHFDRELQNDANMTRVYGEARYGGLSMGGNVRYDEHFGGGVHGSFVTGYAYNRSDWLDESPCVYNWFGQCVFERAVGGELGKSPSDRSLWSHTGYARWDLSWIVHPQHFVRLSVAPTYFTRTGEERARGDTVLDQLSGVRKLLSWVNGAEYEIRQLDDRLVNVAFFKHYYQSAYAHQPVAGNYELNLDSDRNLFGAGDGIRFAITNWLLAKASYEYAVRLPEPAEIFGNGANIVENLELAPERSHNANLSLSQEALDTGLGFLGSTLTGFYRRATDLVVLLGAEGLFQYRNVGEARILGIEGMLTWLSPGEYIELSANGTYQDARNVSTDGVFGPFKGDRMPNRPYLFANASTRLQKRSLMKSGDELSLTWYGRYVHPFFLNWESIGTAATKATVDAQFTQSVVLAYLVPGVLPEELTFSGEVQNLSDEKVFDFYGVQRPGRAVYFKTTAMF